MFGEHHDLVHEFPQFKDKIHDLKTKNAHFAHLFDQYNDIDHKIRRIEQDIETPSDAYTEELKKKRLMLKDELFQMLKSAS